MRFLETDFASHLGGFGRHKTLPFAGLKANETNYGDLRLRPRVDAEQFVFQNAAELYGTVQELVGNPVVEDKLPPGKSRAELNAAVETTISRVWSQIVILRNSVLL